MTTSNAIDQARYIYTTGKMIHDHVNRVLTGHMAAGGKKGNFCELSIPQLHLTMQVRMRGQVTIKELSERLNVAPSSASAMVDRLVERGILTRAQSPEDRRKVVVCISADAMKNIKVVEDTLLRSFVELVEKIGPDTARKWCEVLEQVKSVLDQDQ